MDDDSLSARQYLAAALAEAGVPLSNASAMVGRNHAYIQQYIERGSPVYLSERVRQALVTAIPSIDGERLRPPAIGHHDVVKKGYKVKRTKSQRQGKFIDDPETLHLIEVWSALPKSKRDLYVRYIEIALDQDIVERNSAVNNSRSPDAA